MECSYPRIFNGIKCPCGLCMACRINKRRVWTHRILLESFCHSSNLFVTLTYDDEHLPDQLEKRHVQLFLKRLRKSLNHPIRYYAVGEYGDRTFRPHYHLIIFGMSFDEAHHIDEAWQMGFIKVGDVNEKSIGYTAGYVVKKMTKKEDERLCGRAPEFALMSRKPGIGAESLNVIYEKVKDHLGEDFLETKRFLPTSLRHGAKIFPLGRYLREKLLEKYEHSVEFKFWNYYDQKKELQVMFDDFKNSQKVVEALNDPKRRIFYRSIRRAFERSLSDPQRDENLKARDSIFRSKARVL